MVADKGEMLGTRRVVKVSKRCPFLASYRHRSTELKVGTQAYKQIIKILGEREDVIVFVIPFFLTRVAQKFFVIT